MKKSDIKAFLYMAGCQLLTYFLFCVNTRALAQGRLAWTFFSDLAYATVSYTIIKRVSENKTIAGQFGFIMGGAFGSVLAIMLTKLIFHE